jgi:prefoldin subunit 5
MSELIEKLWLTIEVLCNIIEVLVNSFIKFAAHLYKIKPVPAIRIRPSRGRIHIAFNTDTGSESVDARIEKIDSARESLADALAAMDELKTRAQENKRDLEFLTHQIQRAEVDKASLSEELKTLKDLATLDSDSVRKVLRLPTRVSIWTERVIAFVLGVAASTIASVFYEHVVKRVF